MWSFLIALSASLLCAPGAEGRSAASLWLIVFFKRRELFPGVPYDDSQTISPLRKTWRKLWEQRGQLFPLSSSLYIYIFFISCCGLLGLQEKSAEEVLSFERVFLPCYFNAMGHMRGKTQTVKSICNRELHTPDQNISKVTITYFGSVNTSSYFPQCVCLQTKNITFACTCICPSYASLFNKEYSDLDLKHFSKFHFPFCRPPKTSDQ